MKLCIKGTPIECYHFMNDLRKCPNYDVQLEAKEYSPLNYQQTHLELSLTFKEKERRPLMVRLTTEQGKQIELNLLDGVVVDVDDVTFVSGKIYDVIEPEWEETHS